MKIYLKYSYLMNIKIISKIIYMTSNFKENSFGIAANWLVTIFCILYIMLSGYYFDIQKNILAFCIFYEIVILIIYWILNKRKINNLSNLLYNSMNKETNDIKQEKSKLTKFKTLMLILSNVPLLYFIYYLIFTLLSNKKKN